MYTYIYIYTHTYVSRWESRVAYSCVLLLVYCCVVVCVVIVCLLCVSLSVNSLLSLGIYTCMCIYIYICIYATQHHHLETLSETPNVLDSVQHPLGVVVVVMVVTVVVYKLVIPRSSDSVCHYR